MLRVFVIVLSSSISICIIINISISISITIIINIDIDINIIINININIINSINTNLIEFIPVESAPPSCDLRVGVVVNGRHGSACTGGPPGSPGAAGQVPGSMVSYGIRPVK